MGIGEMMYEPWYNKFEEENRKAKEEHNKKIERQKNCQHKCHICKAPIVFAWCSMHLIIGCPITQIFQLKIFN